MIEETLTQEQELDSSANDQDVNQDSSLEETQLEEPTSEEGVEKEVPFHQHPRFKELVDQKNEAKQQADLLQQKLLELTDKALTRKEPSEDPYADLDGESKRWLKQRDVQVEEIARRVAAEERKKAEVEIQMVRNEYGKVAAQQFLSGHPDVNKGSDELRTIVNKAREIGGNLDDAYKIVMFEKNGEAAARRATQKKQQQIKEKLAANVETKGTSDKGLKPKGPEDFDSAFLEAEKELGILY